MRHGPGRRPAHPASRGRDVRRCRSARRRAASGERVDARDRQAATRTRWLGPRRTTRRIVERAGMIRAYASRRSHPSTRSRRGARPAPSEPPRQQADHRVGERLANRRLQCLGSTGIEHPGHRRRAHAPRCPAPARTGVGDHGAPADPLRRSVTGWRRCPQCSAGPSNTPAMAVPHAVQWPLSSNRYSPST